MTVFNQLSDAYDAYRPDYPPALYEFLKARLGITRDARVTDIACGTGKSTLPLCALSEHVTGIELAANMLFHARRHAAEAGCRVSWVQARAEATGLFSNSQDLVTVAQAFHWFGPHVLDELVRVLRPGGALAIYWNVPLMDAPYYQALNRLIEAFNPDYQPPYPSFRLTEERLLGHRAFETVETPSFPHEIRYTIPQYLGYQASRSFVGGAITGDAWTRFSERLTQALQQHCPDGIVRERYHCDLYLALKA